MAKCTILVRNFNTSFLAIDRSRQKISKYAEDFNQLDLDTDIYKTTHPVRATTHSFQVHTEHSPS